jgi:hypothetical protein
MPLQYDSVTGYPLVQPLPSLEQQILEQDYINKIQDTINPVPNLETYTPPTPDYNTVGKSDLSASNLSSIEKKQEYLRQLANESAGTSLGVLTGRFISKIAGMPSLEKQEQAVGNIYLQAKEAEGREKRLSDFHVGLTTKAQGFAEYIKGLDDDKKQDIIVNGVKQDSPAIQNIRVAAEKAFDEEIQRNHTRIRKEDLQDLQTEKQIWVDAVVAAAKIPTNPATKPTSQYQWARLAQGEENSLRNRLTALERRRDAKLAIAGTQDVAGLISVLEGSDDPADKKLANWAKMNEAKAKTMLPQLKQQAKVLADSLQAQINEIKPKVGETIKEPNQEDINPLTGKPYK